MLLPRLLFLFLIVFAETIFANSTSEVVTSSAANSSTSTNHALGVSGTIVKSFSEWKHEKVQAAREELIESKARAAYSVTSKVTALPGVRNTNSTADRYKEVTQKEFNLDVAEALSTTDYLVLYLSAQPGNEKFKEAASQLSHEETAKIIEAYLKALQIHQEEEKQTSRRSSTADLL